MAILTHPLLLRMAQQIDKKLCHLRWIDLYAAQYMLGTLVADAQAKTVGVAPVSKPTAAAERGQTLDLFAEEDPSSQGINLTQDDLLVLALMCSFATSQGQTFISLDRLPLDVLNTARACGYQPGYATEQQLYQALRELEQPAFLGVMDRDDISEKRSGPGVFEHASARESHHPSLILCERRLYLAKYWRLHQHFETWMYSRRLYLKTPPAEVLADLNTMLRVLFKLDNCLSTADSDVDWQALAAAHTLINPFSLITGGPGTGKTTTAASLLCLLIYKQQLERKLLAKAGATEAAGLLREMSIRLLAPTGKAAVRLADAIRFQLQSIEARLAENGLNVGRLSDYLPAAGETVHRFLYELGGLSDTIATPKAFKSDDVLMHRSQFQVETADDRSPPCMEIIIVDESSMMDLALMVELVSLIPEHAQLILLGDHFQLPAVDPGQVFSDCVSRFSRQQASAEELSVLSKLTGFPVEMLTETRSAAAPELGFQPLCELRKTYRFAGDLKRAADYIKQGELYPFMEQFRGLDPASRVSSQVVWHALNPLQQADYPAIVSAYQDYFAAVAEKAELSTLLECFEGYQLLCSTLEGPLGVDYLNRYIEQHYQQAWQANVQNVYLREGGALYHGKAILVSRNHPHLGIFNGDIGFVIEDPVDGRLNVHFPAADQSVLIVPPARIREWQTAYAMTVHKSQGSEYRQVGVVLADYAKELLTRSLLYTALTRSKQQCDIWAADEALKKAFELNP